MPPLSTLLYSGKSSILPSYTTSIPYPQATSYQNLENYILQPHHVQSLIARGTRRVPGWENWMWRVTLMFMFTWVFSAMCVGSYILGKKKRREEENEKVEITGLNNRNRLRSIGHEMPYVQEEFKEEFKEAKAYQRYREILFRRLGRPKGEWLRKRKEAQKEAAEKKAAEKKAAEEKASGEEASGEGAGEGGTGDNVSGENGVGGNDSTGNDVGGKDATENDAGKDNDVEDDSDAEKELKRKAEKVKKMKPLRTPIPWDNYDNPPEATMGNERDEFDTRIPMPRDRRKSSVDRARRQSVCIQQEDRMREDVRRRSSISQNKPEAEADAEAEAENAPKRKEQESELWTDLIEKVPPPWKWMIESEPWLRTVLRKVEVVNGLYHYTAPPDYPPPGFLEEIFKREDPRADKRKPPKKPEAIVWGPSRGRHCFLPDLPNFEEYEHPWDEYYGNINEVMRPLNMKARMWMNESRRLQRATNIHMDEEWKKIANRKGYMPEMTKAYEAAGKPTRPMKRGPAGLPLPDEFTFRETNQVESEPVSPKTTIPRVPGLLQVDSPEGGDNSKKNQDQENKSPWKSRLDRMTKFFNQRGGEVGAGSE
ncbi:hypothetical protein TWF281_006453 [Arthrobotrys megalospora]